MDTEVSIQNLEIFDACCLYCSAQWLLLGMPILNNFLEGLSATLMVNGWFIIKNTKCMFIFRWKFYSNRHLLFPEKKSKSGTWVIYLYSSWWEVVKSPLPWLNEWGTYSILVWLCHQNNNCVICPVLTGESETCQLNNPYMYTKSWEEVVWQLILAEKQFGT